MLEGGATCERSEEQGAEASANKSLHIGGNCELLSNFNVLFCINRIDIALSDKILLLYLFRSVTNLSNHYT